MLSGGDGAAPSLTCRERSKDIMIVVEGEPELLEVIAALSATGRLTGLLDRREEQGDQDRNNGDDDQQLDQSETGRGKTGDVEMQNACVNSQVRMNGSENAVGCAQHLQRGRFRNRKRRPAQRNQSREDAAERWEKTHQLERTKGRADCQEVFRNLGCIVPDRLLMRGAIISMSGYVSGPERHLRVPLTVR